MEYIKKGMVIISKAPNEEERKKLQKMAKFNSLLPLYMIGLLGLIFIINYFLKENHILWFISAIAIILAMIFLALKASVLKKCPRCSSWGTPVTGGNCPKCGLHLDPSYKEDKKHTTI